MKIHLANASRDTRLQDLFNDYMRLYIAGNWKDVVFKNMTDNSVIDMRDIYILESFYYVRKFETAFPWFINTAHEHGAKIHGLGYTSIENLKKYRFDSVDSTAWLYGSRGGWIVKFNPVTGMMDKIYKEGCRLKTKEAAINNFIEWAKFSKYAELYY